MSEEKSMLSQAAVPLPQGKKSMVTTGCVLLVIALSMVTYAISIILAPKLTQLDAMGYYAIIMVLSTAGAAIMTPIGGKLGDMFGRRNMVVVFGALTALSTAALAFAESLAAFALLRFVISLGQGGMTSLPYALVNDVHERRDIPKVYGIIGSALTVGGFLGSVQAGFFADKGLFLPAIMLPVLPTAIGVACVASGMPNIRKQGKLSIDYAGMALLAVAIACFVFAASSGPQMGFGHPYVLGAIAGALLAFAALVAVELRVPEPVIPVRLFITNKPYRSLLIMGMMAMFYQTPLAYTTVVAQVVIGSTNTAAGTLQLPRSVIVIIFSVLLGAWVAKHYSRRWQAMCLAFVFFGACFVILSFTTAATPILALYAAIGLTGIGEALRSVSVGPSAQATLKPEERGVGTALLTFLNTLTQVVAAAIGSVLMGKYSIEVATSRIFAITGGVCFVGLLIAYFVIRRQMDAAEKSAA